MEPGVIINGRYKLIRKLGQGGMGEVYLATDQVNRSMNVALKTLGSGVTPTFLQYFKHEFKALTTLNHPNLAKVYDFGQMEGNDRPFFTSEFIEGRNLLQFARGLDFEGLYGVVVQICRALEYIHNRGLIHHDIKPENILVVDVPQASPPFTVKLIDFGLVGRSRVEDAGAVPGTIHYIAPEIIKSRRRIDRRSDLYSLGVVLYQVSTGSLPFDGETQIEILKGHLEGVPIPAGRLRPGIPKSFEEVMTRLLAKEPSERYSSAADVIRAINRFSRVQFEVDAAVAKEGGISSGRFVGREGEFGKLKSMLFSAVGGGSGFSIAPRLKGGETTTSTIDVVRVEGERSARFVAITGRTGIGKTRLLNEFKYHVQLNQIPFLEGRCSSSKDIPLSPITEVLRQILGTEEGLVSAEGLEPEIVKILPEFKDRFKAAPSPQLNPRQERLRLMDSMAKVLLRTAVRKPFVLSVPGLDAADEMTIEFLGYLARTLALEADKPPRFESAEAADAQAVAQDIPRMLVCCSAARDESGESPACVAVDNLVKDGYIAEMPLAGLSPDEVAGMVQSMLGADRIPAGIAVVLHRKTRGNPYFVEEIVKTLVEEGLLFSEGGEWRAKGGSIEEMDIPVGVAQALKRRLDRLSADEVRILEQVSVFSRPAPLEALSAALGAEPGELFGRLERLASQEILEVSAVPGLRVPGYGFRHSTLKDLVCNGIDPGKRRKLHAGTGEALEKVFAERIEDGVEEIAGHFLGAGDPGKGAKYGLWAGRKARALCANKEALDFFTRALELVPAAERKVEDLEAVGDLKGLVGDFDGAISQFSELIETRKADLKSADLARLHRMRGETRRRKGDLPGAVAFLEEGIAALGAEAQGHVEGVKILSFTGFMNVLKGDYPAAMKCLRRALRSADLLGAAAEFGPIYNFIGHVYYMRSSFQKALKAYHKSLAHSEKHGNQHGVAAACDSLGNTWTRKGNYAKALEFNMRSHEIRKKMGDIFLLADSLNNIGHLYIEQGDLQKAIEYETECLGIRERIGDDLGKAACHLNLGIVYDGLENYGKAIESFTRSLEIRRRHEDQVGMANALNNIGIVYRVTGELDKAIDCLEQSLALSTEQGRTERIIISLSSLGEVYCEIGDVRKARELLNRGLKLASSNEMKHMEGVVNSALGEAARILGDWDEGEKLLKKALEIFRELGNTDWICYVDITYATLCYEIGQFDRARQYAREAMGIAQDLGIRKVRTSGLLIQGLIESEMGREAEALEMLGEARDNAEAGGNREALWKISHALGNLYRDAAKFETAEKHYAQAAGITDSMASRLGKDLRDMFMADRRRRKLAADFERLKGKMMETRHEITLTQKANLRQRITDLENVQAQLLKLLEVNKSLNSEHNLDNLLNLIMDSVVEISEAERGFLILMENGRMEVKVARNINREEIQSPEFNISHSIAKQVMDSGKPIILTNAQEDERFSRSLSVLDLNLRSVLSFPFRIKNRVIGALYVDNRFQKGIFSERILNVLDAFGDQAAIAIENAQLYEENIRKAERIEKLNKQLEEKLVVTRAELEEAKEIIESSRREFELKYNYDSIIGKDSGMKKVLKVIDRVLDKNIAVLIQGESGTGKELIAKAIHFNSPRRNERFVSENCAAISESLLESELFGYEKGAFTGADQSRKGLFEIAHRGTMLLDEIGDMSLEMQAKLLRVLNEGEIRRVGGNDIIKVDVRIISATNQNLREAVAQGRFREDLFYRVSGVAVTLPPLRERRQDIPMLVDFFVKKVCEAQGMAPKAIDREVTQALTDFDWPGNIRELENEITRLVTLSDDRITADHLSPKLKPGGREEPAAAKGERPGNLRGTIEEVEKSLLFEALKQNRWNKTRTAKELGLSRVALHKKLAKYGMK